MSHKEEEMIIPSFKDDHIEIPSLDGIELFSDVDLKIPSLDDDIKTPSDDDDEVKKLLRLLTPSLISPKKLYHNVELSRG